jgi:nucleoid DNA-binding protein
LPGGGETVGKTLTFNQFVDLVAQKTKTTRKETKQWIETTFETIKGNLNKGIKVPGFGKFHVRQLKARMGRNPATGEAIKIPARSKVAFAASKELKEKDNKKGR